MPGTDAFLFYLPLGRETCCVTMNLLYSDKADRTPRDADHNDTLGCKDPTASLPEDHMVIGGGNPLIDVPICWLAGGMI